jgi:flagellar hook-length control protein FliK
MQGKEAHIAFRTDELQAREALENAGTQLKDMLLREGLVLSGVSVGSSGARDPGDQERKPRQGVKTANVSAIQPLDVPHPGRSGRASGQALDLFV